MALLAGQWADAISQLISENFFSGATLWHNGNSANNYAELIVNNDSTGASVKPTELDLEAAYTRFQNASAETTTLNNAVSGLRDKIILAQTYAPNIKALFNIVLEQYENNSSYPARYDAVRAIVDACPNALRNRIHNGLQRDTGLDPALIVLDSQRGQYFQYVMNVATMLALLLSRV